jgi:hypothetical protein
MDVGNDRERSLVSAMRSRRPIEEIRALVEGNPALLRRKDRHVDLPLHYTFSTQTRVTSSYMLACARCFLQAWPEAAREWIIYSEGKPIFLPLHLACAYDRYFAFRQDQDPDVAANKAEAVRILVEAYPDACQEKDFRGDFPLDLAVKHLPVVGAIRAIVRAWPNAIEESYRCGTFVLHEAISSGGSVQEIQFLIEQRPASLREVDTLGRTALHTITHKSKVCAVHALTDVWRESVRVRDSCGKLPLHHAAQCDTGFLIDNEFLDILELLLELDPGSIREKDNDGRLPIHLSAETEADNASVRLLIEQYPEALRVRDRHGDLPLHRVLVVRARYYLEPFVEQWPGAILEKPGGAGSLLPIHDAAVRRNLPVVAYFVERCPEAVRVASDEGLLPIHFALLTNDSNRYGDVPELVRFLAERHPPSLLEATNDGLLPLHYASTRDLQEQLRIVRFLVEQAPQAVRCRRGKACFLCRAQLAAARTYPWCKSCSRSGRNPFGSGTLTGRPCCTWRRQVRILRSRLSGTCCSCDPSWSESPTSPDPFPCMWPLLRRASESWSSCGYSSKASPGRSWRRMRAGPSRCTSPWHNDKWTWGSCTTL